MEDIQFSLMALYFIGALLCSVVGIFALGYFIDIQRNRQRWILSMIFPVVLAAIAANALLVQRDVTNAELELAAAAGIESPLLSWVLRLATGIILALCAARLISVSQQQGFRSREGKSLYLSFLFLFFTTVIVNNFIAPHPYFDQRALYPLIIFTTFYFSRNKDRNYAIDATKGAMLLFFGGCLAAAVAIPNIALQTNYDVGWLPGLHIRLWGLGPGPNSIGPLAVVFLMLLAHKPFARRLVQWAALTVGLGVLVLAQSKTAWISAFVCFPILWWGQMRHPLYPLPRQSGLRQLSTPLLICVLGLIAVLAALVYNMYGDLIAKFTQEEDVATLTGRTYIWQIAIEAWAQNPIFGYGSAMWDNEFRQMIGMDFAYHAHNQILQAASVSGTVGVIGLLIYVFVLLRYSLAANRPTRGLSLALFAMLMIRSATETPFDLTGVFNGEFVMHLLLFRLVLLKDRQPMVMPARHPLVQRTTEAPWGWSQA